MPPQQERAVPAPTLETVAARAGVSRSTVSRVVNGSSKVTPQAIEAVTRAIADLRYVPNRAARSLASRRTETIALVVPEPDSTSFAVPYFASVMQSISRCVAEAGHVLTVVTSSGSRPEETRRALSGGNVGGALVIACSTSDDFHADLDRTIPVVFAGHPMTERPSCYVDVDHAGGAYAATEHLITRGRRNIATIAGPQNVIAGIERLSGWRMAMETHYRDTSLIEYGNFSPTSGTEAMRRLLARGVPIDGLFAANDQMAAGAYSAIFEAGLEIPNDIAVVGYDNDDYFGLVSTPPLTTVHQRSATLGETAVRMLIEKIDGPPVESIAPLPVELLIRQSA